MADDKTTAKPESHSRFYRKLKRFLSFGLAVSVLLLVVGYLYEQSELSRISKDLMPLGEVVDIGGRGLHVRVEGEGEVTVVLNAGAAGSCLDWTLVSPEVAKFARVVSFDRAGLGWSDTSSAAPTARNVVDDLHIALQAKGIDGPFVLVGHSLGGQHMRMYQFMYPQDVVGLVLVDPAHEAESERFPPEAFAKIEEGKAMLSAAALLSRVGITRLLVKARGAGAMPEHPELLSEATQAALVDLGTRRSQILAAVEEFETAGDTHEQVRQSKVPLSDLPLTVLAAGKPSFELSPSFVGITQELCAELATASTVGRCRVIENSAHYIHIEQPNVVVEEIRRMVDALTASTVGQ